jgi:hypothetical protein
MVHRVARNGVLLVCLNACEDLPMDGLTIFVYGQALSMGETK